MELSFQIEAEDFKKSIDETRDRFDQTFSVAKNMIASMMKARVSEDIRRAGNFGDKFLSGLSVEVDGDMITTTINSPGAGIFETGGTIHGAPLLWLPLSGTDAEGIQASNYGDKLFSVNRKTGGVPLLFSIKDRAPKYFGVPSVNIPKKFHIEEIQKAVMDDFQEVFENALGAVNG